MALKIPTVSDFLQGEVAYSLARAPAAALSLFVLALFLVVFLLAPVLAPHDPYDLASLNLMDSFTPPVWLPAGNPTYLLGTDNQGRDILSSIIFGGRVSMLVGLSSVAFALVVGIAVGLLSGYAGGIADSILMRIADIQLTFPTLLIALLVNGVVSVALPREVEEKLQIFVIIFAIGISNWPQFARTIRGSTLVERGKEYVLSARVIGITPLRIMLSHILPNVLGPILVVGTLSLGHAILAEATLSFLGIGLPTTQPSLGTLINTGNQYIFSGQWWAMIFPGAALVILVLAINVVGDWLRDLLNPRLD